jgi:hypothetical protein
MPSAAASIAKWEAAGNPAALLRIENIWNIAVLPPLPDTVQHLDCYNCSLLIALPRLPPKLLYLGCRFCPALRHLPPLPPTLEFLNCEGCTALTALPLLLPATLESLNVYDCKALALLPPLPATLTHLWFHLETPLPDACPPQLRLAFYAFDVDTTHRLWRAIVTWQHTADRRRAAAALPPLALLYV